jgi:hypothetical protein
MVPQVHSLMVDVIPTAENQALHFSLLSCDMEATTVHSASHELNWKWF